MGACTGSTGAIGAEGAGMIPRSFIPYPNESQSIGSSLILTSSAMFPEPEPEAKALCLKGDKDRASKGLNEVLNGDGVRLGRVEGECDYHQCPLQCYECKTYIRSEPVEIE